MRLATASPASGTPVRSAAPPLASQLMLCKCWEPVQNAGIPRTERDHRSKKARCIKNPQPRMARVKASSSESGDYSPSLRLHARWNAMRVPEQMLACGQLPQTESWHSRELGVEALEVAEDLLQGLLIRQDRQTEMEGVRLLAEAAAGHRHNAGAVGELQAVEHIRRHTLRHRLLQQGA